MLTVEKSQKCENNLARRGFARPELERSSFSRSAGSALRSEPRSSGRRMLSESNKRVPQFDETVHQISNFPNEEESAVSHRMLLFHKTGPEQ